MHRKILVFIALFFGTITTAEPFNFSHQCTIINNEYLLGDIVDNKTSCSSFNSKNLTIKIGDIIGEGGFSTIYSASVDGIEVIIKQIELDLEQQQKSLRPNKEEALQEYLFLSKLYTNTGISRFIVKPYAFLLSKKNAYIVMEHGGKPIAKKFKDLRSNPSLFTKVARQLFNATAALHDANLVHMDLHPENILINKNNEIKIIDFGFTKKEGETIRSVAKVTYRAPEVFTVKKAYFSYDYFSVAMILYEILTGKNMFLDIDNFENLSRDHIKPDSVNYNKFRDIHQQLLDTCKNTGCDAREFALLGMLHPQPEKRITYKNVLNQL